MNYLFLFFLVTYVSGYKSKYRGNIVFPFVPNSPLEKMIYELDIIIEQQMKMRTNNDTNINKTIS